MTLIVVPIVLFLLNRLRFLPLSHCFHTPEYLLGPPCSRTWDNMSSLIAYSRASVCLAAERLDNNVWSAVEASRFAETEDAATTGPRSLGTLTKSRSYFKTTNNKMTQCQVTWQSKFRRKKLQSSPRCRSKRNQQKNISRPPRRRRRHTKPRNINNTEVQLGKIL